MRVAPDRDVDKHFVRLAVDLAILISDDAALKQVGQDRKRFGKFLAGQVAQFPEKVSAGSQIQNAVDFVDHGRGASSLNPIKQPPTEPVRALKPFWTG